MPSPDGVTRAEEWMAPRMDPLSYPGRAPDHHYVLLDEEVHPVEVPDGDLLGARLTDGRRLDDVLVEAGLVPLAERVPVVAYGANRVPHTLAIKFVHHAYHAPGDTVAVPVLTGVLPDLDVVAAGLSPQGYLYADITPSEGTRPHVHLNLLDVEQARAIHASEGVGSSIYDCARVPAFEIDDTELTISPLAYAGCHPVLVPPGFDGPMAFADIPAEGRRFDALGQLDVFARFIESCDLVDPLVPLLGLSEPGTPKEIARETARALSGAWWYAHHTGDAPTWASRQIVHVLWAALAEHGRGESTSARLAGEGRVLTSEEAYASGTDLRLAAQLA